ncbi:thioredoxin domain-containing protein 15 [Aplysia californica]|uniref:Thioredoxin domain-containing protein 15 n=1 Tax=Aplysia californica TaxID=6500 RepID=A0ABM0JC34_APLCA|nr:thioredoxin domain-containing protein 15 [Aplysia californica]
MKFLSILQLICACVLVGDFGLHGVTSEDAGLDPELHSEGVVQNERDGDIVHDAMDKNVHKSELKEPDFSDEDSHRDDVTLDVKENGVNERSGSSEETVSETDAQPHAARDQAQSGSPDHCESKSDESNGGGEEEECKGRDGSDDGQADTTNESGSEPGDTVVQMSVVSPSLQMVVPESGESGSVSGEDQQESTDGEEEQPRSKQRFFPLLYTFRTLFTSFLAEFTDDSQEAASNSSEPSGANSTATELLDKDNNSTGNGTDTGKKTRFQCAPKNISENTTGEVKVVNSTELLEILNFSKNQKVSTCVLVMFYAPWCHFCARTAPHYNALARAYPQLDVLAVDTSHFSYLNARFGTVAVPNVMLFHSRSAVRFNHSSRVLDNFIDFVTNNTGMEPNVSVTVEPFDYFGPLPSTAVRGRDWLLWLAWAFVLSCSGYGFVCSHYGQGLITRLRVLWQEHQHIE